MRYPLCAPISNPKKVIGRMPAVVSPAEPVKLVQRRRTSSTISDNPSVAIAR